jgi:uncharacterized protein (DUF302 family)
LAVSLGDDAKGRRQRVDDHGLTTISSAFSVRETIDRLERIVVSKGLIVFARIDHAKGAAEVGMALRPTELLLFGHPRGGTPLMQDRQTAGIDLPVKALAWEDAESHVWLTYNRAAWLARRHQLGAAGSAAVTAIDAGQRAVILAATAPSPPTAVTH